ncbi:hypothetical protein KKA69_06175, partial [Patescibacteria group bacterium]|nr:hypothetical protein [Patescibacteria group bacterium]
VNCLSLIANTRIRIQNSWQDNLPDSSYTVGLLLSYNLTNQNRGDRTRTCDQKIIILYQLISCKKMVNKLLIIC